MTVDKSALKRLIDQSRPDELVVLTVNKLEKDSVNTNLKLVEKFIKKSDDYVITVIRK